MHAKKLLSLVLLAVLTVSVLTGCSLEDWLEQFLGDSSSSSSSSSSVSSSSQPGSDDDGDDQPTVRYYNVTVNITGADGGTVSYGGKPIQTGEAISVTEGEHFQFTAAPNTGYSCTVTVNGAPKTPDETNTYTLDNVTSDQTVSVAFARNPYNVTVTISGDPNGGKVAYNGQIIDSTQYTGTVYYGDNFPLAVDITEGYSCTVTLDEEPVQLDNNNTYTLNDVSNNHDIEITFTRITHTVTVNISNSSGGTVKVGADNETVTGSETFTVNDGDNFQFTAEPADGYTCSVSANGNVTSSGNSYTVNKITSNITVTVTFEKIQPVNYTINVSFYIPDGFDVPTRCYMQVGSSQAKSGTIAGDKYTFTASVMPGENPTILFWADNGTDSVTDLQAVSYQAGKVAYAGQMKIDQNQNINITLKPVTAKVSLVNNTGNAIQAKNGETLTLSLQSPTTYNVSTGAPSNLTTNKITYTFMTGKPTTGTLSSFYVLSGSSKDVTLNFRAYKLETSIKNNVTAGSTPSIDVDLTSSNPYWEATITDEKKEEVFKSCLFDGEKPKGEPDVVDNYILYSDSATVHSFFETVLKHSFGNCSIYNKYGYSSIIVFVYSTSPVDGYLTIQVMDNNDDVHSFTIFFGSNSVGGHDKTFLLPDELIKDW